MLFPLGGISVAGITVEYPLVAFLLPHALALLLIGRYCSGGRFPLLAFLATLLTLVLTALYPLFPSTAPVLLPLVGVGSAFLSIQTCAQLRRTNTPLLNAGAGLVAGNLILLLGLLTPLSVTGTFSLLALMLLLPLLAAAKVYPDLKRNTGLFRYLPLVFIFHLASGIMYGGIMPAFSQNGIGQGWELLFYVFAVVGGISLFKKNREYVLALGIMLAMFSFSCFLGKSSGAITLSMYAMQAAAGCIDIFILGYLLSFENPLEAFGVGNGTVCLSIFCGHQLAVWIGPPSNSLVRTGFLVLTGAVFALHFLYRDDQPAETVEKEKPLPPFANNINNDLAEATALVQELEAAEEMLSGREREVLCRILTGETYKSVAVELQLAESTVKTYVRRICDKFGVMTKKELLKNILQQRTK